MANGAHLRLSEVDEEDRGAAAMTTTPSEWAVRLGWGAFLIAGAVVVTSGFEVPRYRQDSPLKLLPPVEPRQVESTPSQPNAPNAAAPEQMKNTSSRSNDLERMNMRELEARIRELEARLADGQDNRVKEETNEVSMDGVSAAEKPRGIDQQEPSPTGAKSARDEQIERETEERARKMVSEIRDQLRKLEGARERQMEEILNAAK